MRTSVTDRYYRTFTGLPVDRVPDVEFGYWPQTIRRWLREGLPKEYETEKNVMFSARLDAFFGFENEGARIDLRLGMSPTFPEEIIQRRGQAVVMRDASGCLAERYPNEVDASSIPHFLEFPVKTPGDWADMKRRYRPDDPVRDIPAAEIDAARQAAAAGKMISVGCSGFYGQLRNWMGFANLSLAFYDYPDMIRDMVDHWSGLIARQIARLPADLPIDQVAWWEDMASKNGPFVSPAMFGEFLQPGYHRAMTAARKHGCALGVVDCDGNPHDIVGNWLAEGVNIMFPVEQAAGCDAYAWRRQFGRGLRMRGAVAKAPLVAGGKAIEKELARLRPLLDDGGFIPHLDHLVPPDISFDNYRRYLEAKRRLIGK